jgi:hypothetical protein
VIRREIIGDIVGGIVEPAVKYPHLCFVSILNSLWLRVDKLCAVSICSR